MKRYPFRSVVFLILVLVLGLGTYLSTPQAGEMSASIIAFDPVLPGDPEDCDNRSAGCEEMEVSACLANCAVPLSYSVTLELVSHFEPISHLAIRYGSLYGISPTLEPHPPRTVLAI